jgi:hypothetical protein
MFLALKAHQTPTFKHNNVPCTYSTPDTNFQAQQCSLHLQHNRHQLSLDGAGLNGLDVDSVNSSSDYFAYLCILPNNTTLHQKECQLRMDVTFDDRL